MARGASITVRIERNRFPAIVAALPGGSSRAVGKTCFAFVGGWKRRAHVASSAYRNSITTDYKPGMLGAHVFTPLSYPFWEEVGNRYRPGHPAFRPAYFEQLPLHTQRVADETKKAARA